jgi:hypothetical protein
MKLKYNWCGVTHFLSFRNITNMEKLLLVQGNLLSKNLYIRSGKIRMG